MSDEEIIKKHLVNFILEWTSWLEKQPDPESLVISDVVKWVDQYYHDPAGTIFLKVITFLYTRMEKSEK